MTSLTHRSGTGKRLASLFVTSLLLADAASALAQNTPKPEVYDAGFFAPFAPQTALDLIRHVPGFTFDPGDEGVRGFSEAGGNVLIDGERPSAKSGGLTAVISAIPAAAVARIEIIRGGVAASESSGQSLVANIVLVTWQTRLANNTEITFNDWQGVGSAYVTLTGEIGRFSLNSRTSYSAGGQRSHGTRDQFDITGNRIRHDSLTYATDYPEYSQRLTLSGPLGRGQLTTNAMLAKAGLAEVFTFANPAEVDSAPKRTDRSRGEISADWSRDLGHDYSLKLLGLTSALDLDSLSLSRTGVTAGELLTTNAFESHAISHETILRVVLARGDTGRWRPEIGAEATRNTLDSLSTLTNFDEGVPLPSAPDHVLISENRVEAFAALNWQPGARWTVGAGAAYEVSNIRASDKAVVKNRFAFLKPHLTISYKPDAQSDLRLSLRRSVGQLSFNDFASSTNFVEGMSSSGNPNLGPDHKVTAALDYDRRFGARGAINFSAYRDWRSDVLEPAVLPSGGSGVINVPSAQVWGVAANMDLPLEPGLRGGLLKLHYARVGSHVVDPVTGQPRRLTGTSPEEFTLSLRQDLVAAQAAWGVDYAKSTDSQFWYVDEARDLRHSAELSLFVETSRYFGAKLKLAATGLYGIQNLYRRALYTPYRSGAFSQSEVWDIRTPTVVSLTISRNF